MKMFHLFHKPCSDQVRRLASFQSSYWTTCPPSDITVSWLSLISACTWVRLSHCCFSSVRAQVAPYFSHANLKSSSLGTVVQQTKYRVHAVQTKCSGRSAVFYFEGIYYFLYTFCSLSRAFSCLEPPPLIPHAVQVFRWEAGRSEVLLLYVFVLCFLPVLFNLASRICVTVTDIFFPLWDSTFLPPLTSVCLCCTADLHWAITCLIISKRPLYRPDFLLLNCSSSAACVWCRNFYRGVLQISAGVCRVGGLTLKQRCCAWQTRQTLGFLGNL